jgi:hypothetical protein
LTAAFGIGDLDGARRAAWPGFPVRRLALWPRFVAPRAGFRVEEVRAFVARRNFAMPGG